MTKLQSHTCKFVDQIPCGKILLLILSVFISQRFVFTPILTACVVGGILFHELGHAWAAKNRSVGVRGVYVFPWGSGLCIYKRKFSWRVSAYLNSMGPVFSVGLSLILFVIGSVSRNDIYMAGACANALTALNCLLPIGRMDGRKMLRAVFYSKKDTGLLTTERIKILLVYVMTLGLSVLVVVYSIRWSFVTNLDRFFAPTFVHFVKYLAQLIIGHGF